MLATLQPEMLPIQNITAATTSTMLGHTTSMENTTTTNGSIFNNNVTTTYFTLSSTQKIIYYIALSTLFILGTTGNTFVIYIISKKQKKRTTNFDIHIISLAVADLLASIFLPLVMIHDIITNVARWHLLGDFGCKLFTPMPHINSLVSALTLAAISIERLLIIKRKKLTPRSLRKTVAIVLVLWFVCIMIVSPYIYVLRVNVKGMCYDRWNSLSRFAYYAVVQSLSCFIPMIIMIVVYTLSTREMKSKKVPGENDRLHTRRQKSIQKMTQMFGAIVVIFFLMTTPYMVSFFVVAYYGTFDPLKYLDNEELLVNLQYATYTLMAFNACIDPLIYSARYKDLSSTVKNYISVVARKTRKFGVGHIEETLLISKRKNAVHRKMSKESTESIF